MLDRFPFLSLVLDQPLLCKAHPPSGKRSAGRDSCDSGRGWCNPPSDSEGATLLLASLVLGATLAILPPPPPWVATLAPKPLPLR
jgi:hypothetical protein